ncbi:MAG TPA: His/Gly/Thr/Pro-type tRNA ligase C-terminal domain-containing protein, partial [Rubrobacter sp.]|nr:His/Gly/Thr/Pro-type tRNA ligase C-terminal domain-containing protein [Rubrobacter sp.]
VQSTLADRGLRVEVDDSQNSMQKKIRENARQKIPYLLIVGDLENAAETVNVRRRGEKAQESLEVGEFARRVLEEVAARE